MFYKIGFWVLLVVIIGLVWMFVKSNPMKNEGALSWVDIYSEKPTETLDFLNKTLGVKVASVNKIQGGLDYNVIKADGQMWPFAGLVDVKLIEKNLGADMKALPHSMIYLTVKDYYKTHDKMIENNAEVILGNTVVNGMRFGIYKIPGNLVIGIAQYEHVKK